MVLLNVAMPNNINFYRLFQYYNEVAKYNLMLHNCYSSYAHESPVWPSHRKKLNTMTNIVSKL